MVFTKHWFRFKNVLRIHKNGTHTKRTSIGSTVFFFTSQMFRMKPVPQRRKRWFCIAYTSSAIHAIYFCGSKLETRFITDHFGLIWERRPKQLSNRWNLIYSLRVCMDERAVSTSFALQIAGGIISYIYDAKRKEKSVVERTRSFFVWVLFLS